MEPARKLKEKLDRHEPVLGLLLTYHLWLDAIEMAIHTGLDYLIIDDEHLDHGGTLMADACRMGRLAGIPIFVRPQSTDTAKVMKAVDLGCCGLLLPMVERLEQLEDAQKGVYMPPRGERRPGGPGNRWLRQYNYASFKSVVEDHFIVIAQVESPDGIRNADAIAHHNLVTALGIGPFDLSARLGICFEPDHPKQNKAWSALRSAAERAGKPMWAIGNGRKLMNEGHYFICFGEASIILEQAVTKKLEQLLTHAKHGAKP